MNGVLGAVLLAALLVAGSIEGPSDMDALRDTAIAADTQGAINDVAATARMERVEATFALSKELK